MTQPGNGEDSETRPRIREQPEDFRVDEVTLYPASGQGEHTYVRVEKRLRTTEEVAHILAGAAGLRARDVGFAGRKDRRAVTRQWFSVPGLDPQQALALDYEGIEVQEALRHAHKLRPGQLAGNRFRIVVRGVDPGMAKAAEVMLAKVSETGLANRFGKQRFGRDGRNAERGIALMRGEEHWQDRRTARLMVSALQSAIFNRVLDERPWPVDRVRKGDVAVIHASGGEFLVAHAERENARAEAFEISPSGPLFGPRMRRPAGEVAELEASVLAGFGIEQDEIGQPPFRMRGERRPLRVRVRHASCQAAEDHIVLSFELPPGTYATILLAELFPDLEEFHPPHDADQDV